MSACDLFRHTHPNNYRDDDESRALAWVLVRDWFLTLAYRHSERVHQEILESLSWSGMCHFVQDASLHVQDEPLNFEDFAAGIRHQAHLARAAGRVLPDGKPRKRRRGEPVVVGDLFDAEGGAA